MSAHFSAPRPGESFADFERRVMAAMRAARAKMTGRTSAQVDDDIHRARLANLDPPELGEGLEDYCSRMIGEHGTTYQAAVERYGGAKEREAAALRAASEVLNRLAAPGRGPARKRKE